ncbi:hypothetical protein DMC30DRAFT_414200 [Rhodotorula diobovata]|uniref:Uncharacterized protein n=1 Tax=Rhodotorula diobovata TaxID=5288 RepID=A0A5C5G2H1_9BASI|nr:hypothetical protein DMC30DRAFT_414200 [Rhodotorula diobovata]
MCYAAATLFYGITVNAIELCTAALGYLRVQPALLAVDLIRARRRDGLLKTDSPPHTGGVRGIPVDLWGSIRGPIVGQSFVDECEITARSFVDEYWEDDDASGAPTWRLSPGSGMASLFSTNRSAWEPFMVDGGVPAFTGLNELAVALSFDSETGRRRYPTITASLPHDGTPGHTLMGISPAVFNLPPDANDRFRRLVSAFPVLAPISHLGDTMRTRAEARAASTRPQAKVTGRLSQKERLEKATEERKAAGEPRWVLWGSGSLCI